MRRCAAAGLLGLWVRIPQRAWICIVSVVCCQVEISAKSCHSSRGVLPNVVRRCVWSRDLKNEEALAQGGGGLLRQKQAMKCCVWLPHASFVFDRTHLFIYSPPTRSESPSSAITRDTLNSIRQ